MTDIDKEIARLDRLAGTDRIVERKARERKKVRERDRRNYVKVTDKKARSAGKTAGMETRADLKRKGWTLTKPGYERKALLPRVKR